MINFGVFRHFYALSQTMQDRSIQGLKDIDNCIDPSTKKPLVVRFNIDPEFTKDCEPNDAVSVIEQVKQAVPNVIICLCLPNNIGERFETDKNIVQYPQEVVKYIEPYMRAMTPKKDFLSLNEPWNNGMSESLACRIYERYQQGFSMFNWMLNVPPHGASFWPTYCNLQRDAVDIHIYDWADNPQNLSHRFHKVIEYKENGDVVYVGEANAWFRPTPRQTGPQLFRCVNVITAVKAITGIWCWHPWVHSTDWGMYGPTGVHPIFVLMTQGWVPFYHRYLKEVEDVSAEDLLNM